MSLICCRKCDEPRCDGCNIYRLIKTVYAGELETLIETKETDEDRAEVKYDPNEFFSAERKNKRKE